jgi:hypothetical protein
MFYRVTLSFVACGILVGALASSGCGGNSVTSLPSSDDVATDAAQFCGDVANYIASNESSLLPFECAGVGSVSLPGTGGSPAPNTAQCEASFNSCISEASSVDSGALSAGLSTGFVPDCTASISKCAGVTVGQASQCISDFVSAWSAAASTVTASSACSGTPAPEPANPASCSSLPSTCKIGASSVSVSVMSSGSGG